MNPLSYREAMAALEALPIDELVQRPRGHVPRVTVGELHCRLIFGSATPAEVGALLKLAGLLVRADRGDGEVAA